MSGAETPWLQLALIAGAGALLRIASLNGWRVDLYVWVALALAASLMLVG